MTGAKLPWRHNPSWSKLPYTARSALGQERPVSFWEDWGTLGALIVRSHQEPRVWAASWHASGQACACSERRSPFQVYRPPI